MKNSLNLKRLLTAVLAITLLSPMPAMACGGGGGGGGGGNGEGFGAPTSAADEVKSFSRSELEDFFSGLPDGVRELVIDRQEGKPRTIRQLSTIRGLFLQAERWRQEADESYLQSWEEIAVVLDEAGQWSETVLSVISGGKAELVTGTVFSAIRAGADQYRDDKEYADILQAIAVSVAVNNITSRGRLGRMGDRKDRLVNYISRASELESPKARALMTQMALDVGIIRVAEEFTEKTLEALLNIMADQVRKIEVKPQAPMVRYVPPPAFDETPLGIRVYR